MATLEFYQYINPQTELQKKQYYKKIVKKLLAISESQIPRN